MTAAQIVKRGARYYRWTPGHSFEPCDEPPATETDLMRHALQLVAERRNR